MLSIMYKVQTFIAWLNEILHIITVKEENTLLLRPENYTIYYLFVDKIHCLV